MCKKLCIIMLVSLCMIVPSALFFAGEPEEVGAPEGEMGDFSGRTLSILVNDTHVQVVDAWKPLWERETGGKINVILVPYAGLSDKMWIEFRTQSGTFDCSAIPSTWLGDVAGGGHVAKVDPLIDKWGYPDWDDTLPAIQVICKWAGETVAFPYDGDNHMTYYRKDALENPQYQRRFKQEYGYDYHMPPKDWDEVRDISEFFNEWDWDNDGEIEYGCAFIAQQNTQAMWEVLNLIAQYATKAGPPSNTTSNIFFNADTMEPLCNTPGWVESFKRIQELTKFAPPGLLGYGYSEFRYAYVSGIAALGFDWGDVGIMEQYPDEYGSVVKGKLGYGPLPGAKKYWDHVNKRWVNEEHQVNFLNFGGWVWIISNYTENVDMAYHWITYITNPEHSLLDACGIHGYTGVNPWRKSHFDPAVIGLWKRGGWDEGAAIGYGKAIQDILTDPYAVTDLRIPGAEKYYSALDTRLAEALAWKSTPEEACEALYKDWVKITDEYGKDNQKRYYRESLGLD
jgi:multiple sugar transport system substrate-binding protein